LTKQEQGSKMPWYEPAARAPTSQQRYNNTNTNNDDHVNVQNYLDEQWNFPRNSNNNNNNYDGLQFEIENQLRSSGVLPSSLSMNNISGNYSALQFGGMTRRGEVEQSSATNNLAQQNNEMNHNSDSNMPVSKTAAFFHPRPVMALMPYKQFFSPIACPDDDDNDCGDVLDDKRKQSTTNENHNVGAPLLHNSQAPPQQEYDFQQSQQQQHHLTPADDNLANINQTTQQEDQQGSTNSNSPQPPSSNLKPKDLFSSFIAKPISTHNNNAFKVPPKQSKLVKDSNTGQMKSSLTTEDKNNSKKSSWDDYGGRPTVDNDNRKENASNKDAAVKKKKKKKKSKQQQQSDGTDITNYLNGNKKRVSNEKNGNKTKKKKKQRKSNTTNSTGTELDIPSYNTDDILDLTNNNNKSNNNSSSIPKLTQDDFAGIEEMELQNVAQCMEGMHLFLEKFGNQQHVAFSLLFLDEYTGNYTSSSASNNDNNGKQKKSKKKGGGTRSNKFTLPNSNNNSRGYEVTTPFVPSSKKYCTPKGQSCTAWNCTCDDQIRSLRASASLLGAMFVFKNDNNSGDNDEGMVDEWECFLLPLGPTNDEHGEPPNEIEYQRMSNWPIIPFLCGVSLSDRWAAFEAILLNQRTKLVTYNATVSLLPYYQHLASDVVSSNSTSSVSAFAACIAGGDNNNSDGMATPTSSSINNMRNDGYIQSIWDLRLVSWMLRDNATDTELEFSKFQEGFAHLAPQDELHSNMSAVMQGCISAKNSLQLVYKLYPIMNGQLVRGGLLDSLEVIEQPVQSILAQMECRGVGFFPHRLKRIEVQLESRLEELTTSAIQITKDPDFLLSSPQQVSSFLFDTLKLSMPAGLVAKNKTVHRSTSEEALKAIRSEMKSRTGSSPQIIDIILESRQLNKLLTTYIRPLPKVCRRNNNNQASGSTSPKRSKKQPARIYPQWMQTATRTGRLSCRKPNLQQIPKKGAFGVDPREAFAADQGLCLFACDYSQKEVRILAHMSGDEALLSLFRGDPNIDIYKQMSSIIRNKPM